MDSEIHSDKIQSFVKKHQQLSIKILLVKRIVVSSIQVMLSKDDVIDNPELMGMWVKQNLGMRSKMEGCALAKQNFGNGSPFSNTKIEKLECMKEFKDKRRQA